LVEINKYLSDHKEKSNVFDIAYMLATTRHETYQFPTGEYFSEKSEVGPVSYFDQYDPVLASTAALRQRAINNENTLEGDGYKYRGRGCVHLTWKKNYRRAFEKFNFDYVSAPDLAGLFEHAVPIMFWGMRDGVFTGVGLRNYINPGKIDYRNARRIINGTNEADLIASYAKRFEDILIKASDLSLEILE
jgi:hypothetical protein